MPSVFKLEDTHLNGITSDMVAVVDDRSFTTAILGLIQVRSTVGRDPKLACGNGFQCGGIDVFDNGHIMALELGGSNGCYNIVPQFKYWQESGGPWRQFEESLKEYNQAIMHVEVRYDRPGHKESTESLLQQWLDSKLMDWLDPRIPNFYKVDVHATNYSPTQRIATFDDYLKAKVELNSIDTLASEDFDLGFEPPEIDRARFLDQIAVRIFNELWDEAQIDLGLMTPMTYMAQPTTADLVRERLAEIENIMNTEASGFQMARICRASFKMPMGQLWRMWEQRGGQRL